MHKDRIEKEYIVFKSAAKAKLDNAQKQEQEAQRVLCSLGVFQIGEKSAQKKRIMEAQSQANQAKKEMSDADKAHRDAYVNLPYLVEQEKERLLRVIAAKYPIPKEPTRRTNVLGKEAVRSQAATQSSVRTSNPLIRVSRNISEEILSWMEPDVTYSLSEICEGVPSVVTAGLSKERVESYMNSLCERGVIVSAVVNNITYYTLS